VGPPLSDRTHIPVTPILAVNFVGTLGFSVVLPFLVFLVARWGGNGLVYGVMGATYSAFQLVGAPVLGRWSDIHGRRRILLLSQLGTLASWGIFVLAFAMPERPLLSLASATITLPLLVMFLARALDGLTGGNVSVASAYLADITPEETRSANFGRMAVAGNLGFIVGPAIAGVLGGTAMGELLPVLAALTISGAATLLIALWLPESQPCRLQADPEPVNVHKVLGPDHKPCFQMDPPEKLSFRDALRIPRVGFLLGIHFLVWLGFNFFYVAFPMHAVTTLQWTVRQTGVFFSVLSLLMVLVQGPILSRAARRWRDGVLALCGSLILAASFPLIGARGAVSIYVGAALLALGNGLMWPSLVSILSKAAGTRYQGAVQGLASSVAAVASILGLLAGGALFEVLGHGVFLIAGAIILVVFGLSFRLAAQGAAGVDVLSS